MFATFAHRVLGVLREMNHAQYRLTVLRTAPDWFAPEPHRPPDDYAEFLFRTSGALRREPSADSRRHGQLVR